MIATTWTTQYAGADTPRSRPEIAPSTIGPTTTPTTRIAGGCWEKSRFDAAFVGAMLVPSQMQNAPSETRRGVLSQADLQCRWPGAGSNRRPITFQAIARTN